MPAQIYLDYAAATPMDKLVHVAMQPYFNEKFYNPSALYLAAKDVTKDIAQARRTVAGIIGAKPSEIIFTAGGTEANNIAINGVMQTFPGSNLLVSSIEHESILEPAHQHSVKEIAVHADGSVDPDDLAGKVNDKTVLISIMYANNEIGTVQPLREIAKVLETIKQSRLKVGNSLPLYLHTDAAQATNYLDMHVHSLGVDLMTINGGKIYGPKQSGALYVKTGTQLKPQVLGGGQERSYRSGTENVPGIIGFATAMQIVSDRKKSEVKRLKVLQDYFIREIHSLLPTAQINGSLKKRLPNNVHITIPGQDNERLMMVLDENGIMCATGSACSASSDEPSHVLKALGISDKDAQSSLRFSMGIGTTKAEIDKTVKALKNICL